MSVAQVSLGTLTSGVAGISIKAEDSNNKFQRGDSIEAVIQPTNGAFVGTAKIQGTNDLDSISDGAAVWVDLLTLVAPAGNSGGKVGVVTAYRRMRLNVTAFTSGSVDGLLLA